LKGIDEGKRVASIIGNEDIGVAELNMRERKLIFR
jgi:hypothetical protein